MNIEKYVTDVCKKAQKASRILANQRPDDKNKALNAMADLILAERETIKAENKKDLDAGQKKGLSKAMLDRLELTDARIDGMAKGLREVAELTDPVGEILDNTIRPSGIEITKIRVPIGVIAIIYESRPNVTADAAGLCLKSGNAVILRGGSEAFHSNLVIANILRSALKNTGLPEDAVQFVETTDRKAVDHLLHAEEYIDVIIPRGGKGLIKKVATESRIPVLKHYDGICHTYIAEGADIDKAIAIAFNAKVQRPGVCNAMETLLINKEIAKDILPPMFLKLRKAGVEIRGCDEIIKLDPSAIPATEEDWNTEYLDLILSVKVVDNLEEAINFINEHSSHHSDAIVTEDHYEAAHFLQSIDSATVYVNASTRFTDGGEFGMGAEMGISTDKLHARGPVGLVELTSYKYMIRGNGTIRK
ncbi:MAG: glutamate-5-semialdehyde dehydrogenase [Chlamydiae bacterium]|nr:MAG: glutamate-5-semialdehyde dehydrogenase [Chlamydiota bacterium]